MYKKYNVKILRIICSCILLIIILSDGALAHNISPAISAEAAVLLDWNCSRILFARNPYLPRPMASITKIMTAVLALEMGSLEDQVVTSYRAAQTSGSSIWLEEGELKTLEELLYGLMLRSGNDAAVAIAEHLAGDEKTFAEIMTRRAREIGARNTIFQNAHGLHHAEHYTTAYDYSLIASHAMAINKFKEIVGTEHIVISWPGRPWERHLYNQNKLLEIYPGAEGIKTGWTTPAGRCFAGAATRNGRRLIVILLNAPDMWEDAIKLMDYGFNAFICSPLIRKGQHLKTVQVLNSREGRVNVLAEETFIFPMQEGEEEKVSYRFKICNPLYAPLHAEEKIGELEIFFERDLVGTVGLIAASNVKKITIWQWFTSLWEKGVCRRG